MKYIFLKPFGHKDSSGVCSFVQIHPYFFTIVSASIFLLTLADFACTFMIFKKMLLCRDGFGKNYVCHLILHDLGISKEYVYLISVRNFYGHYIPSTLCSTSHVLPVLRFFSYLNTFWISQRVPPSLYHLWWMIKSNTYCIF